MYPTRQEHHHIGLAERGCRSLLGSLMLVTDIVLNLEGNSVNSLRQIDQLVTFRPWDRRFQAVLASQCTYLAN